MKVSLTPVRRVGAILPVALAVAGAGLLAGAPGGPPPGSAGDRYRAGEPATERRAIEPAEAAAVRARGLAHAAALGLPTGPAVAAERVLDRFAGVALDEIVVGDGRGRELAVVRMRPDGRVSAAVRLGWRAGAGARIDTAEAAARAVAAARAAGLGAGGRPVMAPDVDDGWRATWARVVDGVPVVGDGATVTLYADGTFHAAAERVRSLAPAPASRLARADAERLARERLDALLATEADQASIVDLRLAWVAPNDTFDAAAPDAPDPVLRLAWVARARTTGLLAERLRALDLYLDAGDGALLGGDLLR